MKYLFTLLIFTFLCTLGLYAQSLEEDINIIYMKANVLYDSERYDEAIQMYNRVLNRDDKFVQAYIMRAKTKYKLGAFRGVKNDAFHFLELAGTTKEVIRLMAQTEVKLENYQAAKNYLITSLELDPYDSEQYKLLGDVYMILNNKNEACEQWTKAVKLGNTMARDLIDEYCDIYIIEHIENDDTQKDSTAHSDSKENDSTLEVEGPDKNTVNKIIIDESLTVAIGNGLGTRKVENVPNIFMISNSEGFVVIDICVDGTGKVITAELNTLRTNLNQRGLISLALRKAKEFEFFPSFRQEQCGFIIFDLKS